MLKGHVFSKQIFGNPIFALFIDTFLSQRCGIANNYKDGMIISYAGSKVTIGSGAVCIRGRFIEEDTSTEIDIGTEACYGRIVIEVDLDKENSESEFNQASYKVIKGQSSFPELTQNDIVANDSGIYQYSLVKFIIFSTGVMTIIDDRTFLDFDSIYSKIEEDYRSVLEELESELSSVKNGSSYLLKNGGGIIEGDLEVTNNFKSNNIVSDNIANTNRK